MGKVVRDSRRGPWFRTTALERLFVRIGPTAGLLAVLWAGASAIRPFTGGASVLALFLLPVFAASRAGGIGAGVAVAAAVCVASGLTGNPEAAPLEIAVYALVSTATLLLGALERGARVAVSQKSLEVRQTNTKLREDLERRAGAIQELEFERERLETALGSARVVVWDWDIGADSFQLTGPVAALLHCAPADIPKSMAALTALMWKEDTALFLHQLRTHFETNEALDCDFRIYAAEGELHWLRCRGIAHRDAAGRPARMTGALMDVESRKVDEALIQLRGERLEKFAELSPAGILETDLHGSLTFCNRRAAALAGLTDAEMLAGNWVGAVSELDRQRVIDEWVDAFQVRQIYRSEFRFRREGGRPVWVSSEGTPQFDASGKFRGYVVTLNDITALKEQEALLQDLSYGLELRIAERTADLERTVEYLEAEVRRRESFQPDLADKR